MHFTQSSARFGAKAKMIWGKYLFFGLTNGYPQNVPIIWAYKEALASVAFQSQQCFVGLKMIG